MHLEDEIRDALAGGLDGATGDRRLQDQHGDRLARRFLDQRPRAGAADLLVGCRQDHHRSTWPRVLERKGGLHDAGFHVIAPGAGDAIALDVEWQPPERAFRPDGVVVAQQHDRPAAFADTDLQVVAGVGPPVPDGGHPEALLEEFGDLVRAGVAARLVRGGRLGCDQAFQGGQHGGLIGPLHQGAVHAKT